MILPYCVGMLGVGFLQYCVSISPTHFYVVSLVVQKLFSQPSALQGELLCRYRFDVLTGGGEFRVFLLHHPVPLLVPMVLIQRVCLHKV